MTSRSDQLWELISDYPMPADAAGLSFTDQLMREHGIKRHTAETAIAEYKKFIYLSVTRVARNVPSKAVDLVWHLHMQHSRDYWDGFCRKLGKPIHHQPGGDGQSHLEDYKATIAAYRTQFGEPPKGIWRAHSRWGSWIGLVFVGVFFLIPGFSALFSGGTPSVFMILWLMIPLIIFAQCLYGVTNRGEYSVTFEMRDPFADNDAGDCGSGCGGCGD